MPCRPPCASRARSTRRWSTPISRAARSTISSASRSRRCSGASCRARARRAACSRWRCVSSATASSRSRPSSRRNTGRSSRRSRRRTAASSTRGSSAPTARRSARLDIGKGEEAEAFKRDLELATFKVAGVEAKPAKRHPSPPFMTSTLQQEASRKLGLAPAQTMRIAQRLYEGVDIGGETVGLITYMRTDGVDMAPEAIQSARRVIAQGIRRPLRAGRAAPLHHQGEERPGGARGDPPDRHGPPARAGAASSRSRAGPPLRADLDPDRREPDGIGRARAHHRRHRGDGRTAPARPARHRPGREVRRLPHPLPGGQGRRRRRGRRAACRR